jgi:hypothetical protein
VVDLLSVAAATDDMFFDGTAANISSTDV